MEEEDGGRRINLRQEGGDGILGNVTGEFWKSWFFFFFCLLFFSPPPKLYHLLIYWCINSIWFPFKKNLWKISLLIAGKICQTISWFSKTFPMYYYLLCLNVCKIVLLFWFYNEVTMKIHHIFCPSFQFQSLLPAREIHWILWILFYF